MHVKIEGAGTETFFEYAHRDHQGSIEAVTDANGTVLDQLAYEPYGARKGKDWTANIPAAELDALLDVTSGHTRKARGYTGHEHLDRTGYIHMNGRVYDPVLGRFLSPDPIVQYPTVSQSWNRYSYVGNTPTSFTDPSGFQQADPECTGPDCPPDSDDEDDNGDCWNAVDCVNDLHDSPHQPGPGWIHEAIWRISSLPGEPGVARDILEIQSWRQRAGNPVDPVDPFQNEGGQTDSPPESASNGGNV